MAKDSVKKRLNGEARDGLSFTEFSYQLLQGYDFLHLYETKGCKLQMLSLIHILQRLTHCQKDIIQ